MRNKQAKKGLKERHNLKAFNLALVVLGVVVCFGFGINPSVPGEVIDFKAVDIHGKKVQLSQKGKNLLLFFSPSNTYDKMKLFYAAALDFKLKGYGLRVIGIAKGGSTSLDDFAQKSGIKFPLVADKDYKIHETFGVTHCCGATILIDKTKKIEFFMPRLMESRNLRQLMEKETRGTIDYHFSRVKQDVFIVNKQIPGIPLTEAGTGEKAGFDSMDGDQLVVTFFSSLCGMCKTGKRVRTLIDMEQELISSGNGKYIKFVLVFTGPFDEGDILEWEKRIPMPFEKYITGYLFSEEEKYVTDQDKKNDPLTLVLDKGQVITFVEDTGITEDDFSNQVLNLILRR